jgi:hypothetical protein
MGKDYLQYQIKYPHRKKVREILVPTLNIDTGQVELVAKNKYVGRGQVYPGNKKQRSELATRWTEYLSKIGANGTDFRDQYPLIYTIMRDQFIEQLLLRRKTKKVQAIVDDYHHNLTLAIAALDTLYREFIFMFEEFNFEIDGVEEPRNLVQEYLNDPDHPERLERIEQCEEVLDPYLVENNPIPRRGRPRKYPSEWTNAEKKRAYRLRIRGEIDLDREEM